MSNRKTLLILDFGSQYNQLIARRIREAGVYSEIKPYTFPLRDIKEMNPSGIIFSGGPNSVYEQEAPTVDVGLFELGIPILSICYGMQLTTRLFEGQVCASEKAEYGKTLFQPDRTCPLFEGLPESIQVWMSHGDKVTKLPPGFHVTGESDNTPNASMQHDSLPLVLLIHYDMQ